jgi:cytochrome P450/ribosomal protein S18 acetylase RimI-like enzyme
MNTAPKPRQAVEKLEPEQLTQTVLPWGSAEMVSDPYSHYRHLRATAPLSRDPLGFWLVSRHVDVSGMLRDPRLGKDFSVVVGNRVSAIRGGSNAPLVAEITRWMLNRDPPDHTRLRAVVSRAFTREAVERLRRRIRDIVDDLLADVAERGWMDLVGEFAYVLPVTVICELLGLPLEDRVHCRSWAEAISRGLDPVQTDETVAQADAAVLELSTYIKGFVSQRRCHLGEDLLSGLLVAEAEGSRLTEDELISMVILLFFAGHQTTRDLIGNGMLALLQHPAQAGRVRSDPSLLPNMVEELLRYEPPVQMLPRYARQDLTLAGIHINAGEQLLLLIGAANRDPQRFTDPDSLDVTRPDATAHLSFGRGAHFCLGAALARTEAHIAISALLALPGLELACQTPRWKPQIALRSLEELPVSFQPCTCQPSRPAAVRHLPEGFVIRDATAEEFDQVSAVILDAYQDYKPEPLPPDWADTWEAYSREIGAVHSRADEAQLVVATTGKRIVGAVTFYLEGSRSQVVDWPPGCAVIRLLAVAPDRRRQGIGRALTEECVQRARRRGARAVSLHTDSRMPIAPLLYSQLGFRRAPEFDYQPIPEADITVMGWTKDLAATSSAADCRYG